MCVSGERERERERFTIIFSSSSTEVVQWDIDDVCRWLEELGLGEHCEAFQERSIIGTKLLGLRKSDLQVLRLSHKSNYRSYQLTCDKSV